MATKYPFFISLEIELTIQVPGNYSGESSHYLLATIGIQIDSVHVFGLITNLFEDVQRLRIQFSAAEIEDSFDMVFYIHANKAPL